jgi:hypothetical protein
MTARCVRVVQNVPFSPPRTYLEKDVSPSVLSSGGALSLELPFSNKSLNGALLALSQVLHQRTCGRSIATYGSLRAAPKNPMGKGEITALPSWTSQQPNGHVIAPLDTLDQPCADWMP